MRLLVARFFAACSMIGTAAAASSLCSIAEIATPPIISAVVCRLSFCNRFDKLNKQLGGAARVARLNRKLARAIPCLAARRGL